MKGKAMRPRHPASFLATLFLLFTHVGTRAQPAQEAPRGELLYTTYCVACHNARVHWRDQRLAKDWKGLRAQVRRWESVQKLGWSEADVTEVARYLNTYYYNYPSPEK